MIADEPFILAKSDDSWALQGYRTTSVTVLDDSEVEAAFELAQNPYQARWLERAGVGLQEDPRDNRIAMVQDQVSDNSVLVDTTTLASAEHALLQPAALSLLDLSLATFAFITSDRVVVQPSQQHSATVFVSRFGDACQILEFSREFIDGPLWSVCGELLRALDNNDSQLHGSLTSAWQHFFDRSDIRLNARTIDHNQDSPGAWDGVPATYYAGQALHDHGSSAHSAETLSSFISVQTIRALYNDNLAAVLRIPYLSTSIRSPVYAELLRQKVEAQLLADKLLAQIGPPVALTVQPGPYVAECSAPFLLGIVLSRIKRPDEYWQEVGRLREGGVRPTAKTDI